MRILGRLGRLLSLVLLSVLGSSGLMYCAPGYNADSREMDPGHAQVTRADLDRLRAEQSSFASVLGGEINGWSHGDLGVSRQYAVPVTSLLRERASRSGRLLGCGVLAGWLSALLFALPMGTRLASRADLLVTGCAALLLALPVGALATVCLIANTGGPVLVVAIIVGVKDFKLIYRILQTAWYAPYVLYAQAQGLSRRQIVWIHFFASLKRELISMGVMSFTLALSALVPVEVIFDLPGLGQLAWSAAMNRDLPVLVAVTALMALCVGAATLFLSPERSREAAPCV